MPSGTQSDRKQLSDPLLIAGTPAVIYLLTLTYDTSFAGYFGVPFQFVTVSWTDAFFVGMTLFIVLSFAYLLIFLVLAVLPQPKHLASYVFAFAYIPPAVIALLELFWQDWNRWFLLGASSATILLLLLCRLTIREGKRLRGANALIPHRAKTFLPVVVWIVAGITTSHTVGRVQAKYQTEFYVLREPPDTVVLGVWGDTVVAANFDPNAKTVRRKYIVTKISDHSPLEFLTEKVGPLRLEDAEMK